MTELVSYHRVEAAGKGNPKRDLMIMKGLTRLIGPIGRVRGIGLVTKLFESNEGLTKVYLNDDAVFVFPVYDPYWSYYLLLRKSFERRLEGFLGRIRHLDFTFIDCGANFGYWSALLSSEPWGGHRCIAIEASNETYPILGMTSELNSSRFQCLQYAVYSSSGEEISFTEGARHAGRHIVNGAIERLDVNKNQIFTPDESIAHIETICIDDVLLKQNEANSSVVVKLDVEGAEIDALKGAERTAGGDAVFVYEDFGSDQQVTNYMLDNGYRVYRPSHDGQLERIVSVEEAKAHKAVDKKDDHNYVAWKGSGALISRIPELAEANE